MEKVKFRDSFREVLSRASSKISRNIYIIAIKDGMLTYVPFTFIASIFLILACMPSQAVTNFISAVIHVEAAVWQGKLLYVYFASLAIGGLLVLIAMSKTMAKQLKLNDSQVVLTMVVSYLTLIPLVDTAKDGPAISLSSISAQSMFCSILVAIIGSKIYKFIDDKGWKIKMPSSVPPAVSAPFESLIPSFIVIIFFFTIRVILDAFGTNAVALINNTLGIPLTILGGSLIGSVIIVIFQQLLWFFGLHGSSIVAGVMTPIWQVLEDQNKAASMAGLVPPNIISQSFFTHFGMIGVSSAVVAALIVAKSKQYREIARISVVPFMFGVGEPALFGFPMMLNFTLFIPFISVGAISSIISYAAFALQLVPIPTGLVQVPWTTPIFISGFLVTGSIKGTILQLVCFVVATLIWIPFMKMADKQNVQIEADLEAEEQAQLVAEASKS